MDTKHNTETRQHGQEGSAMDQVTDFTHPFGNPAQHDGSREGYETACKKAGVDPKDDSWVEDWARGDYSASEWERMGRDKRVGFVMACGRAEMIRSEKSPLRPAFSSDAEADEFYAHHDHGEDDCCR